MITVDAYPERPFRGQVVRIATKGTTVSNVVTFDVKVEILDERKNLLRPEMTADIEILCSENDDAVLVPSEALHGVGNRRFVLSPGEPGEGPTQIPVTAGISDDEHTEIASGLEPGMTVLIDEEPQGDQWNQGSRERRRGPPGGMMMPPPR